MRRVQSFQLANERVCSNNVESGHPKDAFGIELSKLFEHFSSDWNGAVVEIIF